MGTTSTVVSRCHALNTLGAILLVVLIGGVALWARAADLGRFVTHDEIEFWMRRSESVLRALRHHDYHLMEVSTHPGVTTMWLGALGSAIRRWLLEQGWVRHETFPLMLSLYRLPVVLVHVIVVIGCYGIMRQFFPRAVATMASVFWAVDPFVVGYSRLLHVDGLMGSFSTLSLLAACLAWNRRVHLRWLILSGGGAGLAILSKSPALALVPIVAILAVVSSLAGKGGGNTHELFRGVGQGVLAMAGWMGVALLTIMVCWPTLWVAPERAFEALRVGVEVEGAQPHMTGNFFLGQRLDAPGFAYYPVTLALRTTPLTLIGLFLLPLALVWDQRRPVDVRFLSPTAWRTVSALVAFILVLTIGLSCFPKKFNRYLVAVFPAVDILAAVGLVWGIHRITPLLRLEPWQGRRMWGYRLGYTIFILAAITNAVWWHPYSIAAFNQLLGGAPAGARTFAVGWGEGLEQVAAWLNEQPNIQDVLITSTMVTSLNPYLRRGARATFPDPQGRLKDGTGYVVVLISQVQGGPPAPPFDAYFNRMPPLHQVTIHGVPYAWIYEALPPVRSPRLASFAEHIAFYGYTPAEGVRTEDMVHVKLVWQSLARVTKDYWFFAHLVGSDGKRYAQIDQPYPTSQWEPGRFVHTELLFPIPNGIPAGSYCITIGLFDHVHQDRLPLRSEAIADPRVAGPNALLLMELMEW